MSLTFTKEELNYVRKLQSKRAYAKKVRQDPSLREKFRLNSQSYRQKNLLEVREKDRIRKQKKSKEQMLLRQVNIFYIVIQLLNFLFLTDDVFLFYYLRNVF
jgi:hypothetical protein